MTDSVYDYQVISNSTTSTEWTLTNPAQQQYYPYFNNPNGWTVSWEEPKPDPIDPDLLMDEGL
jgi:hypothetical protein